MEEPNRNIYQRVRKRFETEGKPIGTPEFKLALRNEIELDMEKNEFIVANPLPKQIGEEMLKSGLIIVGSKGCGKSTTAKIILSQIINKTLLSDKLICCKIFDSCQNFVHGFESIPYQEVESLEDSMSHMDDENVPERKLMNFGDKHMLYDLADEDVDTIMTQIGSVVREDFKLNREVKKIDGNVGFWTLYCVEEAQNVLGSYSLTARTGKFWLKAISEGRNFNMSFIFVSQRLADVSTRAVERATGFLFGKMCGDNDKAKIRRICGKDAKVHEMVSELKTGEFIYWNGISPYKIRFPSYDSHGKKPYPIGSEYNGM
jgi:hypothetical protein